MNAGEISIYVKRHTGSQRMPLGVLRVCEKSVGTGGNTRDAKRASRRIESWIGGEISIDPVGNLEIDVLALTMACDCASYSKARLSGHREINFDLLARGNRNGVRGLKS